MRSCAACAFLDLSALVRLLTECVGVQIAAPSDIAIYGVLCALATFSRTSIKAQVLDNDSFSQYIEQEPYIRELVEAYMGSRFNSVLELLERYSVRSCFPPFPIVYELTGTLTDAPHA